MKLIAQGAEAKLFRAEFEGKPALFKQRVPKEYRCRELDELLRSQRTAGEANLLRKARAIRVKTPLVFAVDKAKKEIAMQFIEGQRLKDALGKKSIGLCKGIGKNIALMHENGLIHGDLTTSNIIVQGGELFFIDFGLGKSSAKPEDRAVDLLVFKKTFGATHVELMPKGWELILEGYLAAGGKKETLKQMEKVEARVRYH
jgi:Kae1-associated kinase Bud32